MTNVKSWATWLVIVLMALPIGAAGVGKLMGVEMMHQSFQLMGLPEWFGYFIGLCELAGAIGLLIPRLSAPAAAGLLAIMLGAISFHVAFPPLSAGIPAFVLALLAMVVLYLRRPQSIWFSGQHA